MRWFWFDRFLEFESGHRAKSVKCITLSEDHLHDHFPGAIYMPNSLVIEGIAQTGGLLVGEARGFEERVVLAKLSKITFHFQTSPGDTLIYETVIEDIKEEGAMVKATSHRDGKLHAEASIFFAHLHERNETRELFDPADFLVTLRVFGLYDVGVDQQGNRLVPPERYLRAEKGRYGAVS